MTSIAPTGTLYGFHLEGGPLRYIGITTRSLNLRLNQHRHSASTGTRYPVYDWIRKHGWSAVMVETIGKYDEVDDLKAAERKVIAKLGRGPGLLLNLTGGGDGFFDMPQDMRDAISARTRGRIVSPETRARQSLAKAGGGAAGVGAQNRRLSEGQIHEIRSRLAVGLETQDEIGAHYGVSKGTIQNISSGKSWSWLQSPFREFPYTTAERELILASHRVRESTRRATPRNTPRGSASHRSTLNEAQVIEIRRLLAAGVGGSEIARRFGVTKYCVSDIKHGRAWGWLA